MPAAPDRTALNKTSERTAWPNAVGAVGELFDMTRCSPVEQGCLKYRDPRGS
ncbi:hypothetical protein IMZ48_04650 [Candidatus Bathyarchaeota archaeon]|nr:hypothetical protein [Candidatus Bathyarchaeota archaeon]